MPGNSDTGRPVVPADYVPRNVCDVMDMMTRLSLGKQDIVQYVKEQFGQEFGGGEIQQELEALFSGVAAALTAGSPAGPYLWSAVQMLRASRDQMRLAFKADAMQDELEAGR